MRRRREDWIIDELSSFAALACDDPAESLARIAAGHGENARLHIRDASVLNSEVCEALVVWHAREAWRFATAALDLYDLYELMMERR